MELLQLQLWKQACLELHLHCLFVCCMMELIRTSSLDLYERRWMLSRLLNFRGQRKQRNRWKKKENVSRRVFSRAGVSSRINWLSAEICRWQNEVRGGGSLCNPGLHPFIIQWQENSYHVIILLYWVIISIRSSAHFSSEKSSDTLWLDFAQSEWFNIENVEDWLTCS